MKKMFYDFFMAPRDLPPSCLAFGPLLPSLKPLRAFPEPLPLPTLRSKPFQRLERGSRGARPRRRAQRGLGRARERVARERFRERAPAENLHLCPPPQELPALRPFLLSPAMQNTWHTTSSHYCVAFKLESE